jgi:hypothetical protein
MKIIKLPDADQTLLQAAFDACTTDEEALDKAHKAFKASRAAYQAMCDQLALKHKIQPRGDNVSDDQVFLYGHPLEDAPDTEQQK